MIPYNSHRLPVPVRFPRRLAWTRWLSQFRLFIALITGLSVFASAEAQPAATGTIAGRVLDASTGRYLNNAQVTIAGTNRTTRTNEYGEYHFDNVPAGEVNVEAFYSGLGRQTAAATVVAGQSVTQDLQFGSDTGPVVLETFTVAGARDTNVASIAVNEQRFSPNIKNVIETDAFGDVAEGNVGEFLKFLPGITVDYVAADVRTVSVRGFGPGFTSVMVDGFRMASASSGAGNRAFEFEQVSINNASRVEVTKVPTPAMPASALGGAVNLIGKNAFERKGAQFNYRLSFNMNDEDLDFFSKTPGPGRKETYKVLPGFDFDYTLPINDNLGFVITGLTSNQFNEQHRSQKNWNFAQAGATETNPYLMSYVMQDGPKNSFRDSVSFKADWRISPRSAMWIGYQANYYKSFFGNRNITWNVGTNAVPSPASGSPLSWGSDFTNGATGRGSVNRGSSFRDKLGATGAFMAKYRYNGADWDFDAGLSYAASRTWYRDIERGHFNGANASMQGVSSVQFADYTVERPNVIRALNAAGQQLNWSQLINYRLTTVTSTPLDAKDEFTTGHMNVAKDFKAAVPFTLRAGVDQSKQKRDITRRSSTWNFVGPDGIANTADDNAALYGDSRYAPDPHWGLPTIQWIDPFLLGDLFKSNPGYFQQTTAQQLATERFRIQNSQLLEETITSAYIMGEAKFIDDRLSVLAGVRYEKTEDDGRGPLTPTPGATLANVAANWRERGLSVDQSYDDFYPSVHVNFNATKDIVLRAAYAFTVGRPDFGNILPLVRINDTDLQINDGIGNIDPHTIIYNNTALKPWEAKGWDLSAEYYFPNGGLFAVGVFGKDIDNFFSSVASTATQADLDFLGLGSEYVGYALQTQRNLTTKAKILGGEINFRQPLRFIPGIGDKLEFFFNATKLDLDGGTPADFNGFIDKAGNTGVTYRDKKVTLRLNVNYRGKQAQGAQTGGAFGGAAAGFYQYFDSRVTVDVNAEYRINRNLALFANARNLFDEPQDLLRENANTPGYASQYQREEFGVQITVGLKGSF